MKSTRGSWGSITRHFDRGWRARAGDEGRSNLGIFLDAEHGGTDGARAEAESELAAAHRAWRKQHAPKGPGITVAAYGRKVLDRWELADARRALDRDRSTFERHIARAPFANDPIAALEHRQIQRWVRDLAGGVAEGPRGDGQRKRSRRRVANILNLLRSILRAAIEEELLDESPARSVIIPKSTTTAEDFLLLDEREVDLVLAARPSHLLSLAQLSSIVVSIFSGMRPGELWGLRWGDALIDADRPEFIVRHNRDGATKGGRVRRIPMLPPARAYLIRWRADTAERFGKRPGDADLVWPNPNGGAYGEGYDATWAHLKRNQRGVRWTQLGAHWQIGIARRVPFKDLRHTCACALLRGWWVSRGWISRPLSLVEIRDWLGHASVTTTERHYARLAPGGLLDVLPRAQGEGL